jgi:hypothetical protein
MEFTKEMIERLHELLVKKSNAMVEDYFGMPLAECDHILLEPDRGCDARQELREDWHSWLDTLGIGHISRENMTGDADRFKGMVITDNPGARSRRPGYLLVPKEVAEKLLVLGVS